MLTSHAVVLWITFGRLAVDPAETPQLGVSVDGCTNTTFSPHVPPLPPASHPIWTEDLDFDDPVVNPAANDQ